MANSSLIAFAKDHTGWSEQDNQKARWMIGRVKPNGERRYTDEQVAHYMGMAVPYVAKLRVAMTNKANRGRVGYVRERVTNGRSAS